jgi:GNAT superfamily N-acetyltransferase
MNASSNVSIRRAVPADADFLAAIEQSGGELFRTLPELAWIADEPIGTADEFLPLILAGTVWVAEAGVSGIVGELRATIADDALHIVELAVSRQFQQHGIGRALIDAAAKWSRVRGLRALTLTTFRHVAWNAPFYARYGFVERSGDARLDRIVRGEESCGLPNRCAMRFDLR